MRRGVPIPFIVMALAVLCWAASLSARPLPSGMDLRLQSWVLAGIGPSELICQTGGTGHDGHADGHCPLCHVPVPMALPATIPSFSDAQQRIRARIVLPQVRRAEGRARDPAIPKRGPPVLT